ncbi:MAG: MBL fold metallo-hydrolase [Dehalococcoidia bacterium]|nr:MBL fold metallo-hydrolase [Dehalococcoidia bacterium]
MIEVERLGEVTRIKMGREYEGRVLYWTAAYLVDGLLIDTGCPHTADELTGFLEGRHLDLAVNTHHHEDHVGANHLLQQRFKVRVMASREAALLIGQPLQLHPYQELVWGQPVPTKVDILAHRVETRNHHFEVMATPGHCPDHVSLVEMARGWCFTGDLFISREPKAMRPEEDVHEIARSMGKLLELPAARLTLFTGLGNVVKDGRAALEGCIDYIRALSRKAKELEAEGFSIGEMVNRLFGRESILAGLTGGHISSENVVRALLRPEA